MKKIIALALFSVSLSAAAADSESAQNEQSLLDSLFNYGTFECNTYPQCPPSHQSETTQVQSASEREKAVYTFKKKKHD